MVTLDSHGDTIRRAVTAKLERHAAHCSRIIADSGHDFVRQWARREDGGTKRGSGAMDGSPVRRDLECGYAKMFAPVGAARNDWRRRWRIVRRMDGEQ
jgi:hypothetical protein